MQKFNIFYWLIGPLLIVSVYLLTNTLRLSHREYYGFAENKQSEINLDKDVTIVKTLVNTGDKVKKGQLLMIVNNTDIHQQINQIQVAESGIQLKNDLTESELKSEILKLEKERDIEISTIHTKINSLQQETDFYKSLVNSNDVKDSEIRNPNETMIKNLNDEIKEITQQYNNNIALYQKMIRQPKQTKTEKALYSDKKNYLQSEINKFQIIAPFDGVIGSINIREGEYVKAFTSLISFYEATPPMVLAYVQEKYDLNINTGDTVWISSAYNSGKKTKGIISAKGNRIVEIPEKFRKIPDVRIYGIEVFINIPADNRFLQKEVLRISDIE